MNNTRGVCTGTAALALSTGLLFGASPAQAASVIDIPQPGENTIQVSTGPGVFQPQFALWPLPPNTSDNQTIANSANFRGNGQAGQAWLLGFGAGNVVQFATGGNIVNPQLAVGTDNNSTNITYGNGAQYNGNFSSSDSTGQPGQGLLIDGNGNIFQVAILQGNIIAPQVAVLGDNNGDQTALGNYAYWNGNNSGAAGDNGFAFITGNGNVIQIEILSDNVIAPQLAVGGNNNLVVDTEGNAAYVNGNDSGTNVHGSNPLVGIFAVTGNGNVTHIAILSNNVWAPQIAPFGTNHSDIFAGANDSQDNGDNSDTTGDTTPEVQHPVLDSVQQTLNTVTGNANRPVLDAVENALPHNQFGNGNTQQDARGSGIIDNLQIGGPTIVAPVNTDADVPVNDSKPKVVNSFVAKPTTLAGDNKSSGSGSTTTGTKTGWKPGDGVKKVAAAVKSALSPKKADTGADGPA